MGKVVHSNIDVNLDKLYGKLPRACESENEIQKGANVISSTSKRRFRLKSWRDRNNMEKILCRMDFVFRCLVRRTVL